jgi:leader peptidase (prepilin peptidase) / N-methyltransferase
VGVLLVWRTGLLSAAPASIGLTMLAASDMATRRVPRTIVAQTTACMLVAALVDALRLSEMSRFLTALGLATLVGLVAGSVWLVSSGIAFGDVKLLALASFVPGWLRGSAVVAVVAVSFLAAALYVLIERLRHGRIAAKATIAFGPPLLVGWLVGVLTS